MLEFFTAFQQREILEYWHMRGTSIIFLCCLIESCFLHLLISLILYFSHFTWKFEAELEKMWSPLTPSEALAEAFERYEAAKREEIAAQHTVNKSSRLVLAISEACEKRPVTGKHYQLLYLGLFIFPITCKYN